MNYLKRLNYLSIITILLFALTGCGSSSQPTSSESVSAPAKILTADELPQLFNDPAKFKGSKVDFYAKAFNTTSVDGKPHIQAWTDIENSDNSVLIETDYKTSGEEYIHVTGIVSGSATGKNAFGAEITAPIIGSAKVEKSSYIDAVAPAIKTIEVNKEINQHGLIVKLQKVEIAKKETRVYFEVTNSSQKKGSFYSFNTKLIQGDKQFEEASNYEADYKAVQSELLPGVKSNGIIAFEPINVSVGKLTVISEGRTDDYSLKFAPYTFDITW